MANVRNYIQTNPIDLQTDVAVGVSLPYDGTGVFNSTYTTKEQLKSNMLNILLTEPGERVYKPNFGVGLRNYLFENFTDVQALEDRVRNQVEIYAPQVELLRVDVAKAPDSHQLNVRIFYREKITKENQLIQVNFDQEGDTNNSNRDSIGGGY